MTLNFQDLLEQEYEKILFDGGYNKGHIIDNIDAFIFKYNLDKNFYDPKNDGADYLVDILIEFISKYNLDDEFLGIIIIYYCKYTTYPLHDLFVKYLIDKNLKISYYVLLLYYYHVELDEPFFDVIESLFDNYLKFHDDYYIKLFVSIMQKKPEFWNWINNEYIDFNLELLDKNEYYLNNIYGISDKHKNFRNYVNKLINTFNKYKNYNVEDVIKNEKIRIKKEYSNIFGVNYLIQNIFTDFRSNYTDYKFPEKYKMNTRL